MLDKTSLSSIISECLPELDSELASEEVALQQRPFHAALNFARSLILEIRDGEKQWTPDFESPEIVTELWFSALFQEIESWYRGRYGAALEQTVPRTANGFVLIWNTPFALRVPTTVITPGKPGRTTWLRFPDTLLDHENPTEWLVSPPNLGDMSAPELAKVTIECKEIASFLRSIMVKLMGIQAEPIVKGFIDGVRLHVEVAAEHILRGRREGVTPRAYWEIQMACECAYKAVLQQKSGSFQEIHDLFLLHDKAALHGITIGREILKKLPRWKEMVTLRYGQRLDPAIDVYYEAYRTMLRVVEAVLTPIVTLGLGEASLEVAKAPWLAT